MNFPETSKPINQREPKKTILPHGIQTEESLRLLTSAVEQSNDSIMITDAELDLPGPRIICVNPAFTRMTGYSLEEILGKTPRITQGPRTDRAVLDRLRRNLENGEEFSGEAFQYRKDGSEYFQEWHIAPIRGDTGLITHFVAIQRDITERNEARVELEWKTAFLEAQVRSSIDGILVVDPNDRKILQNHRMVDLFGIPEEISKSENDGDQLRWVTNLMRDPTRFLETVEYLRSHPNEVSRDELELKNGTFLDRYSAPVCGKDGEHYGRIWTFRDVTERKRNEFALNKSEQLYRSLFESMVEGYAYFRILYKENQARDILYLSVNNAFERLTGLKSVVGRKLSEVIPGIQETNPEMFEIFGRVALTGKTESFDTRLESLGMWLSITVYSHEQGHCIAVFENITEKKRIEGRLRRLMDSNAQSVFFWNTKGEVMEANDAFLGLVGYTREELQEGRINWVELTPPEFAGLDREALEQIVATGSSKPYEKEFIHKDGSRVSILIGAAGFEDNTSEGVCFLLDLTERKLFEAQLMQSQKLETVGKLAGGIAHEFNSIFTAILGQSELLLGELPVGSPQAANIIKISRAAELAAGLTRQLLAYGRKQFLQAEILDLNGVIASMSVIIQHLMGAEVSMQIIADPDLHAVMADAGQIEHVIINLVMNAREAMPNGGKLTVEIRNVIWDEAIPNNISQSALKEGKYVMMAFADTGVGMSDAVKSRVFEPFFTTKEVGEGTGLGLATCYGIIKQSGGHISVESEQGRGSTFRVYLPEVEAKTKLPPQRVESPDLPRGTETILLVEEDPALRELAAALLTSLGYKMLVAGHASEALNLNLSRDGGKLDLLCTDLGLPPLAGWDLVERIRVIHPDLHILFTSSFTANTIRSQDPLQRDVAVLQKPFTPFALARKLREVLDQG